MGRINRRYDGEMKKNRVIQNLIKVHYEVVAGEQVEVGAVVSKGMKQVSL